MKNRWDDYTLLIVGNVHKDLCAQKMDPYMPQDRRETLLQVPVLRNAVACF